MVLEIFRGRPATDMSQRRWKGSLWLLIAYSCAVSLSHIHQGTLSVDGTRYAHIAREILERHDWFRLWDEFMGRPYANKPPILFWLTAISFQAFGYSTFSARLPGALFAALSIVLMWMLGLQLGGRRVAWASALLFSLHAMFFRAVTELSFEGMLVCGGILLLMSFSHALGETKPHRRFVAGFGLGSFLMLAAKPPFFILVTISSVMVFLWSKKIRRLGPFLLSAAPAMFLLLVWYGLYNRDVVQVVIDNQLFRPLYHPHGWMVSVISWGRDMLYYAPLSIISLLVIARGLRWSEVWRPRTVTHERRQLLVLWSMLIVPIVLLVEARGPYLMIPFIGLAIVSAQVIAPRIPEHILVSVIPSVVVVLALVPAIGNMRVHRTSALVGFFRLFPQYLDSSICVCVDGESRPTSRATKKRAQLLLDLEFGRTLPVVSSRQLPLREMQAGSVIVAEPWCARRLEQTSLPLRLKAEKRAVKAFELTSKPEVDSSYSPEPDLLPGQEESDH